MSKTKETNPKDAIGSKKPGIHFVPMRVLSEVGVALTEGACKYGAYNWRVAGVRASVYVNAVWRHLFEEFWDQGLDVDPDSPLHPVTKAIAGLMVLRDSMLHGNFVDDRPPRAERTEKNQEMVAEILKRYPKPLPPYTQQGVEAGDY